MEWRRRVLLFTVVALVVLVAFSASVDARAPPQPLCEVCADEVVDGDVVEESTVTIQIDGTGTGHWTVRLELVEETSLADSAVERRALDALTGHRNEPDPRNLSVSVSGERVVMSYDVPRMGHRSVGDVLIVDYFYSHGDDGHWYGVNADRVVVRGPSDGVLTESPAAVTANETAVVLEGDYGDVFTNTISTGWYLAYAHDRGVVSVVATTLGVGVDVAQAKMDGLLSAIWLPIAIIATVLGLLYRQESIVSHRGPRERIQAVAALTAVLLVASIFVHVVVSFGRSAGPLVRQLERAVFSLMYGTVLMGGLLVGISVVGATLYVLTAPRFEFSVPNEWIRVGGVFVSVTSVVGGIWAAGTDIWLTDAYAAGVAMVTAGVFLPLGLTDRRSSQVLMAFTILTSPALVALGFGPFSGYTNQFFPLLFVPWALVTVAVGTLGYAYGVSRRETTGE